MASGGAGEPSTAPQADRWYTLKLGSSFKDDRPSSKFCTLRYEFQPASIDKSQPGSLHRSKENRITVEFQNNQPGRPKVTFEGASEDCKDNDGILFFDGQNFRLERLHRAVKRLRHVRQPGESGAASSSAPTVAASSAPAPSMGNESRSPPLSKMNKLQPLNKSMAHPLPLEIERIDIGEPEISVSKPSGIMAAPQNPFQPSPQANSPKEDDVDIDNDYFGIAVGGEATVAPASDDEIADVDVSDDDRGRPNAAEALRAQANAAASGGGRGEETPTSSSSGSGSSGSGSSDSDSDGSDDNSSSSAADEEIDIDGDV
ncbi:RNA polymerase II transcription elongation factor [Wolffia australiana]